MLITSGYNFEGYQITEYFGFCSGECAIGTGFLSSVGASIADILGKNSFMYEEKLNKARDVVLDNLKSDAARFGANAIIAVDIDYTVFSADIIGVTASGTAVKIKKIPKFHLSLPNKQLDIKNFNPDLPIRPISILLNSSEDKCFATLSIIDIFPNDITAIACDIDFSTILDDKYHLSNIAFFNFKSSDKSKTSLSVPVAIPAEKMEIINSAHVVITKYYCTDKLIVPEENDMLVDPGVAPINASSNKVSPKVQFMINIKALNSAKEILDYCMKNEFDDGIVTPELLDIIKSCALKERLYGNMFKECVQQIDQLHE